MAASPIFSKPQSRQKYLELLRHRKEYGRGLPEEVDILIAAIKEFDGKQFGSELSRQLVNLFEICFDQETSAPYDILQSRDIEAMLGHLYKVALSEDTAVRKKELDAAFDILIEKEHAKLMVLSDQTPNSELPPEKQLPTQLKALLAEINNFQNRREVIFYCHELVCRQEVPFETTKEFYRLMCEEPNSDLKKLLANMIKAVFPSEGHDLQFYINVMGYEQPIDKSVACVVPCLWQIKDRDGEDDYSCLECPGSPVFRDKVFTLIDAVYTKVADITDAEDEEEMYSPLIELKAALQRTDLTSAAKALLQSAYLATDFINGHKEQLSETSVENFVTTAGNCCNVYSNLIVDIAALNHPWLASLLNAMKCFVEKCFPESAAKNFHAKADRFLIWASDSKSAVAAMDRYRDEQFPPATDTPGGGP